MPYDEYWNLPASYDETTRITRCYKDGKYIVFVRDDGKECKYDLATSEVIGFRGKPVKRLTSQLKDLTCDRLFEITEDPVYRQFFEYVWRWHPNGKAWVFFEFTMPNYRDYEQYFTSGFTNLERRLQYGYSQIPKGLFKFCNTYEITLTNKLARSYIGNPDAFNILSELDFGKCTKEDMIEAMTYGATMDRTVYVDHNWNDDVINQNNLLMRRGDVEPRQTERLIPGRDSYYISLINQYGYNPKFKIKRKFKKAIFQDIYDYADMMTQLYDNYDRYPENFSAAHRRACEEFNRIQTEYDDKKYSANYTQRNVLDYECEIDGFKFIYPRSVADIKEEGIQQHNCVATYIKRVLTEYCHIMFMRPVDKVDESYITLEITNNKIVQAKRKYNADPSDEEWDIIHKWEEKYKDFKLQ